MMRMCPPQQGQGGRQSSSSVVSTVSGSDGARATARSLRARAISSLRAELASKPETWEPIAEIQRHGTATLLYSAKDLEHNHAMALMEFLKSH